MIVSQVYGDPTTGKYDDTKTPVILNIYAADKALQGAKASGIADALKLTGDAATAVNEAVSELATFFTAAVDQYVAAYGEKDAKSGAMTKEGHRLQPRRQQPLRCPAQNSGHHGQELH